MLKEQHHCRVRHKKEPLEIVFETKVREQSLGNDMAKDVQSRARRFRC